MAGRKPVSSFFASIARPSSSTQYICRPCRHNLSLQQQPRPQTQTSTTTTTTVQYQQTRALHRPAKPSAVPQPTPFVPDVSTFLTLIGRKLSTHTSKFQSWTDLFTLSSLQLKELGIEPARSRRYLLRWREKFRHGDYGIGGDLQHVTDGTGELRIVEVPSLSPQDTTAGTDTNAAAAAVVSVSRTPGMTKLILNVPRGETTYRLAPGETTRDLKKPKFVRLADGQAITGSYVRPVKGSQGAAATLTVTEGMWEHRRGRKVFGGERRKAETLHKMRVEERKKNER